MQHKTSDDTDDLHCEVQALSPSLHINAFQLGSRPQDWLAKHINTIWQKQPYTEGTLKT